MKQDIVQMMVRHRKTVRYAWILIAIAGGLGLFLLLIGDSAGKLIGRGLVYLALGAIPVTLALWEAYECYELKILLLYQIAEKGVPRRKTVQHVEEPVQEDVFDPDNDPYDAFDMPDAYTDSVSQKNRGKAARLILRIVMAVLLLALILAVLYSNMAN